MVIPKKSVKPLDYVILRKTSLGKFTSFFVPLSYCTSYTRTSYKPTHLHTHTHMHTQTCHTSMGTRFRINVHRVHWSNEKKLLALTPIGQSRMPSFASCMYAIQKLSVNTQVRAGLSRYKLRAGNNTRVSPENSLTTAREFARDLYTEWRTYTKLVSYESLCYVHRVKVSIDITIENS